MNIFAIFNNLSPFFQVLGFYVIKNIAIPESPGKILIVTIEYELDEKLKDNVQMRVMVL